MVTFKKETLCPSKHSSYVKKNKQLSEIASITFITHISCPASITSLVTQTSHVITDDTVSAMSCTLLTTVKTVPSFFTF